jgi:hypothetical protein
MAAAEPVHSSPGLQHAARVGCCDAVLSENSAEPSGGSVIVPKQPAKPRATADRAVRRSGRFRRDQPVLQTLVIAFPVIVLREGDERAAEVRLAEDHQPGQAFFLDRSDERFP